MRAQNIRGSGLGMAIVKGLVDRMGGTITAESQLHKGSTFTLELPFEKPKVAAQQKKLASLSGVISFWQMIIR